MTRAQAPWALGGASRRARPPAADPAADTREMMRALMRPPPPPPRGLAALLGPCGCTAGRRRAPRRRRRAGSFSDGGGAPAWRQQQAILARSPSAMGMTLRGRLTLKMRLHEAMLAQRTAAVGSPAEAAAAEWGATVEPVWADDGAGTDRFFGRRDAMLARLELGLMAAS
jgi:hypothetical protein